MKKITFVSASIVLLSLSLSGQAQAHTTDLAGYYIGIDGRAVFPSGTYSGLANPNHGRLTLLYNHGDHYHGMGTYSYSGPAASPTVNDTNTNNRLPETFSNEAPMTLTLGTGTLYGDKLTSQNGTSEYANLTFALVDTLDGHAAGSEEQILFSSSSNRWSTLLGNTSIGLQLVSATTGLFIGDEHNTNLFGNGDTISLDNYLSDVFKPIFWTAANAAVGTYSAEFRLIGLNDANINSGRFYFDFAPVPVPVPAAVWMFASAMLGWLGISRHRKAV